MMQFLSHLRVMVNEVGRWPGNLLLLRLGGYDEDLMTLEGKKIEMLPREQIDAAPGWCSGDGWRLDQKI